MALPKNRKISVVLCGSYRKDPDGLNNIRDTFHNLNCEILSPKDTDFVGETEGFVFAEHEKHLEPITIEEKHLNAMREADFTWLHVNNGYVGSSATMELGFAHAQGLPVYASCLPEDVILRELVILVDSPKDAIKHAFGDNKTHSRPNAAAQGLDALSAYYTRASRDRGWDNETLLQTLAHLQGEVSELVEEINENINSAKPGSPLANELADVLLYVIHMANILELSLSEAVISKEKENVQRFE